MRTTFDAVFVGAATQDALALVSGFPRPDQRMVADAIAHAGGGPAATAAVAAARLGVHVAFVGTVGDDVDGQSILAGLTAEGVDVSGVSVRRGHASAVSVVVVDAVHGTRAICNRPGPDIELTAGRALLAAAPVVHVDHVGWGPVTEAFPNVGPRLSVDAGNPIPGFTQAGVRLFVPTVEALRSDSGLMDVDDLLVQAIAGGCDIVVATDGANGSYARTSTGQAAFAPAHRVEIVSTLGAGDVFHGALIASEIHGLPLEQRLIFANAAAALACRGLDGRSTIPRLPEVMSFLPAPVR